MRLVARMATLSAVADLFEIRADFARDLDLAALKRAATKPLLFTCRPESEGGRWPDADPAGRRALLARAVDVGFDLVDVEVLSGFDDVVASKAGRGLVLSWHDFEGTPVDLDAIYEAMAARRPDVVKIAVTARSVADLGRLLAFASRRAGTAGPRLVALAMGPLGTRRASLAAATARPSRSPRPRTAARPPRASCPRPPSPTCTASGRSARRRGSTASSARTSCAASRPRSRTAPSPRPAPTPSTCRCRPSRSTPSPRRCPSSSSPASA